MKRYADIFLRALMTGFAIGIGGAVYLSCDNKYLGAFLFGTGYSASASTFLREKSDML